MRRHEKVLHEWESTWFPLIGKWIWRLASQCTASSSGMMGLRYFTLVMVENKYLAASRFVGVVFEQAIQAESRGCCSVATLGHLRGSALLTINGSNAALCSLATLGRLGQIPRGESSLSLFNSSSKSHTHIVSCTSFHVHLYFVS